MSITLRWRIVVAFTVLILLAGTILATLLSLGLADPPRAGTLQWETDSLEDWRVSYGGGFRIYTAPEELYQSSTLVLAARNSGTASSAWGIKFFGAETPIEFLISNEGYYTFNPLYSSWKEFLHIQPYNTNSLSLDVAEDGRGTIRVNDEIVTDKMSFFYLPVQWGIITYHHPQLAWEQIAVYNE